MALTYYLCLYRVITWLKWEAFARLLRVRGLFPRTSSDMQIGRSLREMACLTQTAQCLNYEEQPDGSPGHCLESNLPTARPTHHMAVSSATTTQAEQSNPGTGQCPGETFHLLPVTLLLISIWATDSCQSSQTSSASGKSQGIQKRD